MEYPPPPPPGDIQQIAAKLTEVKVSVFFKRGILGRVFSEKASHLKFSVANEILMGFGESEEIKQQVDS